METDLHKTEESMRDAHGSQDQPECSLNTYGGSGHSKELPKHEALDCRPDPHQKNAHAIVSDMQRPTYTSSDGNGAELALSRPAPIFSALPSPSAEEIVIPTELCLTSRDHRLLRDAKTDPPVTKKTLSELDLPCIMSNINLRMDANFDRDLHFKPDLDGEKGKRKRKEAAEYWDALAAEISIYAFCASQDATSRNTCGEQRSSERQTLKPRLPTLFETLQDVLKTLVPEREHASITQNLEVGLLMQQIYKGVLDMTSLAKWLAALLKSHCAPMRDEWVDRMVEQITTGFRTQDPSQIVGGLQTLFAILEAMKLDVANHQIRAFRVLLVEDTVPFLQEYFRSEIEKDNFSIESSIQWYAELRGQDMRHAAKESQTDSFWPVAVLLQGLAELLLQFRSPEGFPETFIFDTERLWQLRCNLQNMINLDICWYIFESYIHNQKRYLSEPSETYATFRSRIWWLLEETDDCQRGDTRWLTNVRNVSLEIARLACVACCTDKLVSDNVISPIEEALEWHLSHESSWFAYFQNTLRQKLVVVTLDFARKYLNMSPLAICESQRTDLVHPRQLNLARGKQELDRIGMRLAHIGVLHWRVWAPILYAREVA